MDNATTKNLVGTAHQTSKTFYSGSRRGRQILVLCLAFSLGAMVTYMNWCTAVSVKYAEDNSYYELHTQLLRRGREFPLGKEEIELTIKYWELNAWFKNRGNNGQVAVPEPYNFANKNLWEPGFEGALDKALAQHVWRLQLIIGNYIRAYNITSQNSKYEEHSTGISKRIFVGNANKWPKWAMRSEWAANSLISECHSPFISGAVGLGLEPTCELVQTQPEDWNTIDTIVQFQDINPFGSPPPPTDIRVPWLTYILESPASRPTKKTTSNQMFNTYMSSSPVQHKYTKWVYYDSNIREQEQEKDYIMGKTKMVAMLVSNCKRVSSGRLEYVQELSKYIDVDIFGKCGNHTCPDQSGRSCFEVLQDYKFYLAFENSNCQEYVTEKLHANAFRNDVLPIVMGAPPTFYLQHAPQNSYIHVQDFESPMALAQYLHVLASNATMYNDYFKWKGTGKEIDRWPWLCLLCYMLYHDKPLRAMSESMKIDTSVEWMHDFQANGRPLCLEKGQWYW